MLPADCPPSGVAPADLVTHSRERERCTATTQCICSSDPPQSTVSLHAWGCLVRGPWCGQQAPGAGGQGGVEGVQPQGSAGVGVVACGCVSGLVRPFSLRVYGSMGL